MQYEDWSDKDIRDELKEIDSKEDLSVSQWEANFIEKVCFRYDGPLSPKQRRAAIQILKEYSM